MLRRSPPDRTALPNHHAHGRWLDKMYTRCGAIRASSSTQRFTKRLHREYWTVETEEPARSAFQRRFVVFERPVWQQFLET